MKTLPHRNETFSDVYGKMYEGKGCRTVTFVVTHDCTFACTYCYEHHKSTEKMTFEVAKKCVDMLFDEDANNLRYINKEVANGIILDFIGGEPLLEIDLIDQIMDYFLYKAVLLKHRWSIRYMISISSNGDLYFNPKVYEFIKKHSGRISIGITIDGNQQLHDKCRLTKDGKPTYHLAAKAFSDVQKRFDQHGTKITIARLNLPYLFDACKDMIEKFNLNYLQGNVIFEEEWTNEDALLYYKQLKKMANWLIGSEKWEIVGVSFFDTYIGHPLDETDNDNWCGGTGKMLAFDVDGSCYPCLRYSPVSISKELALPYVIGHCDTGLETTIAQHNCVNCLNDITRRSQSTDECWNCPIASGCAWCSAYNYEHEGSPNIRCTHICPMHHARVCATAYYINTLHKTHPEIPSFKFHVPREKGIEIIGQDEYEMLLNLSAD